MNTSIKDGKALANQLAKNWESEAFGILIPPHTHLYAVANICDNTPVWVGAQNCSEHNNGAYTGEVSAKMLAEISVGFVVLGHSERRQYFGEDEALLREKIARVLEQGMMVIYCCGETKEQREAGEHFGVIEQQVKDGLFHLTDDQMRQIIIAYEPVWAIGTGLTASADQAQEVHAFIRNLVNEKYGSERAEKTSILYGGSVKPANAAELFNCEDIDGGLIGGASLDADSFLAIANA